jgi:hypothetical protein
MVPPMAWLRAVFPLRCTARQPMELSERNRPFSARPADDHVCIHCRKRDRHVGRMGGDASVGPSEDRMSAIETGQSRTPGAGPPLVARKVIAVPEVGAACALHDIAPDRGHVAELTGRSEQQAFCDHRKAAADLRVGRHVAHPGERADANAAIRQWIDPRHAGQLVDVQQPLGQRRAVLDQAKEVSTTRDEREVGIVRVGRDRRRDLNASRKRERMHGQPLRAASAMAATMLG